MTLLVRLSNLGQHHARSTQKLTINPFITSLRFQRFQSTNVANESKKTMITTPIFYVNSSPHLGHLYSCTLADALARFHRLIGKETHFMTGTDEHGSKVQQAAEKNGYASTIDFCNKYSNEFKDLCSKANIQYDDFIRTTEKRHSEAVAKMWTILLERGFIYLGKYEGWYCVSDEAFLTEDQVKDSVDASAKPCKVSIESGHKVDWVVEENYKFKLSAFQKPLLEWLEKNPDVISPKVRATDVKIMIERGLPDLSISRPSSRIRWALPVPNDEKQTIYVWLDALTNYLTSSGFPSSSFVKAWPADYHIIGKDILKFHAVYWPAFLMAAQLPLPKQLIVHAHWTVNRVKMSKSLGNVVSPYEIIDTFGLDPVRFFLLSEGGLVEDGDYSHEKLFLKLKGELADNYGNLIGRCTSSILNPRNILPQSPTLNKHYQLSSDDKELIDLLSTLAKRVEPLYNMADFPKAVGTIFEAVHYGNRYFQKTEPWKIAKQLKGDQNNNQLLQENLDTIVYITLELIRITSILLKPVMPSSTEKILDRLGVKESERSWTWSEYGREGNQPLGSSESQFKAFQIPTTWNPQTIENKSK